MENFNNKKNKGKWYLGLTMNHTAVGFAATDNRYNLIKVNGKDMWGVREFDEAKTSEERRTARITRRRTKREQVRVGILKSYFATPIEEKDKDFFTRLDNSKYYSETKENRLFNDDTYNDYDYHKDYPTIFHLESDLIHNKEPHDVRLVFLALLNMFKHRGHFHNTSLSDDFSTTNFKNTYNEFADLVYDTYGNDAFLVNSDIEKTEKILSSNDYSKTDKSKKILALLGIEKKDKTSTALIKMLCGLKVNAKIAFPDIEIEDDKKIEIDLSANSEIDSFEESLGEENYEVLVLIKQMYDTCLLTNIMHGFDYISDARVFDYDKHKKDLHILKDVIKKYCSKDDYNFLFRDDVEYSYSDYVHSYMSNTGKQRRNFGSSTDDKEKQTKINQFLKGVTDEGDKQKNLYKLIKKLLENAPDTDSDVKYILYEIEKETFLPKQRNSSNSVIPNQVYAKEMKIILKNAESYLPFLKDKDESGLTISERIMQLFTFTVPYYVGPTTTRSEENGGNGWVVRKEEGQVLPWNIKDKIDMKKTSEQFINRMVRSCTYISSEKVMPRNSLDYEKFCVLNEINNIKINDKKISVELKQSIYNDLFSKGKKVTKKQLIKYLSKNGYLTDEAYLSGLNEEIENYLSSYGLFSSVFDDVDKNHDMIEDIIFFSTVYGKSKDLLEEYLEKYNLTKSQVDKILSFNFKDWGRLSKEFINLKGHYIKSKKPVTLIEAMWNTNLNMMELIYSDRFNFADTLYAKEEQSFDSLADITIEDLDGMYFSAPVKRMIWQTILIIKELAKVIGTEPDRIYIEMARDISEKTIAKSRKKQLLKLFKNVKDKDFDWVSFIEEADKNGTLKSRAMYLYITQLGRDIYTGEPIPVDEILDKTKYDIDHIYPQHYVRDDNILNNLVLTKKDFNGKVKKDSYPVDDEIFKVCKGMWRDLHDKKLISDIKFKRLMRRNEFTDDEKAEFISKDIMDTRQGTKSVANIIKQVLPKTELIYSKGIIVSDFRNQYKLYKSRLVNDYYYAGDAYLNIVVGNAYYVKFTKNPANFIKNDYRKKHIEYNLGKMFKYDIRRGDDIAWKAEKDDDKGTIEIVKNTLAKNTPMFTRMNFCKHGKITDATIYGKNTANNSIYLPIKSSDKKMADVTVSGGVRGITNSYFFLVEHEVKGEKVRTIETVPVYLANKIEKTGLYDYAVNTLNLINPVIKIERIKTQSLLKIDGYYMYITGKTNDYYTVKNAVNLCLKQDNINYIKKLENYHGNNKDVTSEVNIELYDTLLYKYTNQIFAKRPTTITKCLADGRDIFINMVVEDQVKVLLNILSLSAIGTGMADLTAIGGSKTSGKLKISKKISNYSECKLINQSVTGFFENEIDLLKI